MIQPTNLQLELPAQEEQIGRLIAEGKDYAREETVSADWNAQMERSQEVTTPEAQAALTETVRIYV